MRRQLFWFWVLVLLSVSTPAWCTTYYVSPSGNDGNTSNGCAPATNPNTALQTLNVALGTCVHSGDTLIVRDGTYGECLFNKVAAGIDAAHPTVVQAEHQRQAIINGGGTSNINGTCGGALIVLGDRGSPTSNGDVRHYITLDGLNLQIPTDCDCAAVKPLGGIEDGTVSGAHDLQFLNMEISGGHNSGSTAFGTVGMGQGGGQYGWTWRNNYFHDIGTVGPLTACSDCANPGPNCACAWSYTIYMSGGSNLIENNDFGTVSSWAIHGYSTGDHFHNNVFRNNYFHDGNGGAMLICGSDNQIYNNVFANEATNAYHGAYIGTIVMASSCSGVQANNNRIYNNTFVHGTGGGSRAGSITVGDTSAANNNIIQNNIVWNNVPDDNINVNNGTGETIDHNLQGTNPQFVNEGARDYHLTSGSPAINAGVDLSLFTTDKDGNARNSPYDIGAYEFGSSSPPPPTNSLVGFWTFEEGTGTTAADGTTNARTLTFSTGTDAPGWGPGKVGRFSGKCNGPQGSASNASPFTTSTYSWAFWWKGTSAPSTTTQELLLINGAGVEPWGFSWGHGNAAFRQAAQHRDAAGTYYAAQMGGSLVGGVWYHLAATFDGSNLKAYLNGVLQATTPASSTYPASNQFSVCGSGQSGGLNRGAQGTIDQLRVWDFALTAQQIVTYYQSEVGRAHHRLLVQQ